MNPRIVIVQKIYEKIQNPESEINFKKTSYTRHIKKVFKGYFEKDSELENEIIKKLNLNINYKNLDIILKIILKTAIFELLFCTKIPFKVVIDEYLNVTDNFFGSEQKKLVNGVLDAVHKSKND